MTERTHTEEYRREWATEVLKLFVARRSHFREILQITKEISEALDRNDRVSVQMLLQMRGKELEDVDGTIRSLEAFKEQLPRETRREIEALSQGQPIEDQNAEMDKIVETAKSCRKLLEDIVSVDKRMSRRIAGDDSFYKS